MTIEKLLYWFVRSLVSTYANIMLNVDVEKRMPFPPGARIIAANHPTASDPFLVANILSQSYILITEQVFKIPVAGACLRKLGHIPVVVGSGQAAIDRALELLKQGETIVIFPEGGLSPTGGGFQDARTGVARLALLSGAPVIPVGIHLKNEKIKRYSHNWGGKKGNFVWYFRGPYFITTGIPLTYKGNVEDRELVRRIAGNVMLNIIELTYQSEKRMDKISPAISRLPAQY